MSLPRVASRLILMARGAFRSDTYGTGARTCFARARFVAILVSTLSAGCDRFFLPKPPETQDGSYLVHVVSGGEAREDIGTILLWYTGSEDTLAAVQMANPSADLSALQPGQRIVIPSSVVTQTNAMPRRKFTLGVDVPPPVIAPPTAVPAPNGGAKSDPLEELMRKHERRAPQQPTPLQAASEPPARSNLVDMPTQRAVEPNNVAAPSSPKTTSGASKLEAFSEDEIGALPVPGSQPRSDENGTGQIESRKPIAQETKNPRPRQAPQPEVFDEE